MPTRILLRLLLLAGLAMPLCAFALGVGSLTVRSALNQNFEAEIPLIVNNPAELVGLAAQIPRQPEFERVGIERLEFLSKLRFAVQTLPGGSSLIKITSVQPIREPNFDLLVEVIWPRGRLLRTFPVQLDPELYAERKPSPPPLVEAPPVQTPPVAVASTAPKMPAAPPVSFEGATNYGPVKRGDNLTRIAEKVRPSPTISVADMMAILVAGNPGAFSNGNPSTLRLGAVLKVPSPQALGVTGAPTPPPVAEVALAPSPAEPSPPAPPMTPPEAAAPPVTPEVPPAPQPVATPMLAVEPAATPVPETVVSPPSASPPAEVLPVVAESPAPMPIAPAQEIVPQATIPQEAPPPAPVETVTPPPVATSPVVEAPPPPVVTPPVVEPPPPTDTDWFSNPMVWIAIALIVLAAGSVLLLPLLHRATRAKTAPTEEDVTPSDDAEIEETREIAISPQPPTSLRKPGARPKPSALAAVEDTAALAPEPTILSSPKPVAKVAATPPPKPINELLKNIDFNIGDERSRTASETQEMPIGRAGQGRRMPDAEPPTASVTRTPAPITPAVPSPPAPKPMPLQQPALEPLSELPSGLQLDKLDFDLGDLGLDAPRKPAELPPLELKPTKPAPVDDFAAVDFGFPDLELSPRSEPAAEPDKPKLADLKFEFADIRQEDTAPEDLGRLDEDLRSFGDGGLDLGKMELSSPLGDGDAGANYIETKLDLATAYLDMGDQVGARGLLDDVLRDGDAAQKKRAEDLLKKLG